MHLVARRATEFGVDVEGSVRFDLERAVARKDAIVRGIIGTIHGALRKRGDAIDFVQAEARFLDPHEIDTGDRRLSFEKAIVATGSRRAAAPIAGLDGIDYLTNRSALELDHLPSRLIVIGGGYVGIEFAQMYGRFGSKVTLLGRNASLAPGEDPELVALLRHYLQEERIDVHTGATMEAVQREGDTNVVLPKIDD